MNLDLLRRIGMTEDGFNRIASLLKKDTMTLEELSFAMNQPPSSTLFIATTVAKEMAGTTLEEAAPKLFASAQSFINERQNRLKGLPERARILKHLDSVLYDLVQLDGERTQARFAYL